MWAGAMRGVEMRFKVRTRVRYGGVCSANAGELWLLMLGKDRGQLGSGRMMLDMAL